MASIKVLKKNGLGKGKSVASKINVSKAKNSPRKSVLKSRGAASKTALHPKSAGLK